ncbi:hypothetical protein ACLOJK_001662 [Asimina triloba]
MGYGYMHGPDVCLACRVYGGSELYHIIFFSLKQNNDRFVFYSLFNSAGADGREIVAWTGFGDALILALSTALVLTPENSCGPPEFRSRLFQGKSENFGFSESMRGASAHMSGRNKTRSSWPPVLHDSNIKASGHIGQLFYPYQL